MTYRQWWLKNLAAVGMPALLTFPVVLYSSQNLIALVPFFLLNGFGLGGIHTPGSNFLSLRRVFSSLMYGCFYAGAAIFSITLGFFLAYVYSIVLLIGSGLLDVFERYVIYVMTNFMGGQVFVLSLALLTSCFSGGVAGLILGLVGQKLFHISRPGWIGDLVKAGAFTGMGLILGLLYWQLSSALFSNGILTEFRWVLNLLTTGVVVILMSTAMSYFTYDRHQIAARADLDQ